MSRSVYNEFDKKIRPVLVKTEELFRFSFTHPACCWLRSPWPPWWLLYVTGNASVLKTFWDSCQSLYKEVRTLQGRFPRNSNEIQLLKSMSSFKDTVNERVKAHGLKGGRRTRPSRWAFTLSDTVDFGTVKFSAASRRLDLPARTSFTAFSECTILYFRCADNPITGLYFLAMSEFTPAND